MEKSGGPTRSGSSRNPRGTGQQRVNASGSQLAIEDRIIALEGERERLRNEGSGKGPGFDAVRIDQINDEIDELREVVRRLERNEQPGEQERQARNQRASNAPATFTEQISAIARRTVVSKELDEMTIRDLNSKLRVTQRAIGQVDTLSASNESQEAQKQSVIETLVDRVNELREEINRRQRRNR